MADNASAKKFQDIASATQGAITTLIINENDYELSDFQRFFTTVGTVNERFERQMGKSVVPEDMRQAYRNWKTLLRELGNSLGLVPKESVTSDIIASKLQFNRWLTTLERNGSVRIPKGYTYGEYYLIPKEYVDGIIAAEQGDADEAIPVQPSDDQQGDQD
jgi:hypothetical protein